MLRRYLRSKMTLCVVIASRRHSKPRTTMINIHCESKTQPAPVLRRMLTDFRATVTSNGSPVVLSVCPVCNAGILWPNGWMDQDASWYGGKRPFLKRFALCYRTVVCVCLSVTLVYCSQTVGWTKMALGMEVGLVSRRHDVRWGPSSPTERGTTCPPLFGPCLLWPNGWMDQNTTWYGGKPRPRWHCVRWGPCSPTERGTAAPPHFSAHFALARSPISATAELLSNALKADSAA